MRCRVHPEPAKLLDHFQNMQEIAENSRREAQSFTLDLLVKE